MHHITVLEKSPITLLTFHLKNFSKLTDAQFDTKKILKNQLNSSFQLHLKDSDGIKIALIPNLRLAMGKGDTNADIDTSIYTDIDTFQVLVRYFDLKVSYFRSIEDLCSKLFPILLQKPKRMTQPICLYHVSYQTRYWLEFWNFLGWKTRRIR